MNFSLLISIVLMSNVALSAEKFDLVGGIGNGNSYDNCYQEQMRRYLPQATT